METGSLGRYAVGNSAATAHDTTNTRRSGSDDISLKDLLNFEASYNNE
jgi:hypothetical protein